MKVSWRWLREYVETDLAPRELARRLTMAGLEAEKIAEIGAEWDPNLVRVASVKTVADIPEARSVRKVILELPEREVMVVTGAPNIAEGQKIALALIGARLYDGHSDEPVLKTLKARAILGITGEGMVCSEKELGISDEHEGILVLPDDAPVGMPLRDYLGDTIIEFEITPNLVHDFSIIGVAREAAAVTDGIFHDPFPHWANTPLGVPEMPNLVTVEDRDLASRYTALLIEGVKIAPSPEWMQQRLTAVGVRPISNVVDVTNYVMLEYGQPTHAFDRDQVVGGRLIVRHARPGETLELINHEVKSLTPQMPAVCDDDGITDLGGIIGGTRSEIRDSTTTVLLEAATWDMRVIRHARQALKIRTDASARFERGLEPELTMPAARRIAELIGQMCPGARVTGYVDIWPNPPQPRTVTLPYARIGKVLGVEYPLETVVDVLTRLQFGVEQSENGAGPVLTVIVPPHRADVSRPEDLIEEVARVVGYESIPETLITGTTVHVQRSERLIAREAVRDALAAVGIVEILTYSFTSRAALDKLATVGGLGGAETPMVRLVNPMGDWEGMRPTLRASLLATASENLKFVGGVALGEVSNVYLPKASDALPDERLTLGIVLAGQRGEQSLGVAPRPYDFFDLKGMVEALFPAVGVANLTFAPTTDAVFQPGRVAAVTAAGARLGALGEVHPRVAEAFGLSGRVLLAELDLEPVIAAVAAHRGTLRALPPISRFPATENDLAVVVDEGVAVGEVQQVLAQALGRLAQRVVLFDVYRGEQIAAGKKSLAFAVTLHAPDRALSDDEVAKLRDRAAQALAKRLKATLRS